MGRRGHGNVAGRSRGWPPDGEYSPRRYITGETCDECGTRLRSSLALMSHRGSRPCLLAKTEREMKARGWEMCRVLDAEMVLVLCDELEYEKGPGIFLAAGLKSVKVPGGKAKKYFDAGSLDDAFWCPAWAVPFVEERRIDVIYRARIINTLRGDQTKINALKTAIALEGNGGVETLIAYAERERDAAEERDDD